MLVLSRKKGQSLFIGDDIEISILEVNNDTIKIGITAPKEISILRKELYVSVEDMNRAAEKSLISNTELKKQFGEIKKNKL
ncbi:carbon storage regulator CsrA [Paenibacillus algorifonticola]|uniref:carbon storage regulator CsrA n=1 Tax=Paenibacillus algorifonticola TaxID=684063 RepID=UPI003D269594